MVTVWIVLLSGMERINVLGWFFLAANDMCNSAAQFQYLMY